jgi:hypothetical protein
MASHYISTNRGKAGFVITDFNSGTSSTAGDQIELRVLDGAGFRHIDVIKAIQAFIRVFENAQQCANIGFDVET